MVTRQEILEAAVRKSPCAICGKVLGPGPIQTAGEWVPSGAADILVLHHAHAACADAAGWVPVGVKEWKERIGSGYDRL